MTGLTKQHFKAIAEILHRQNIDLSRVPKDELNLYEPKQTAVRQIIEDMADYFVTQNPLFNKEKFLEACLK